MFSIVQLAEAAKGIGRLFLFLGHSPIGIPVAAGVLPRLPDERFRPPNRYDGYREIDAYLTLLVTARMRGPSLIVN